MPLSDTAQTQYNPDSIFWRATLLGVRDNARVQQCRRFERVLVQEKGTYETALGDTEDSVWLQRGLHVGGAYIEQVNEMIVAAGEALENAFQLRGGRLRRQRHHPIHDLVDPGLVDRVAVAQFRPLAGTGAAEPGRRPAARHSSWWRSGETLPSSNAPEVRAEAVHAPIRGSPCWCRRRFSTATCQRPRKSTKPEGIHAYRVSTCCPE